MKKTEYKKLLLTGGGTGGHLFPAIAAAQEFCKTYPNTDVLFVGTKRKMDSSTLSRYGFRSVAILCYGLKGKRIIELLKALLVLPLSCLQALWVLLRFRPDIVVGVGGYVTGPVVAMAKILGFPTLIHEQNSVPGLANRKLGGFVDKICLSLPQSAKFFPSEKIVVTGNPVRENLIDLSVNNEINNKDSVNVLVLGGSQGATGLNKVVIDAFTGEHADKLKGVKLIHQTGLKDQEWVATEYRTAGRDVEVHAFIKNMDEVYQQVDFLISRAGATTLAELAVLGKPAILVPYPYAADNHQQKNAEHYVDGGGAVLFEEKNLTSEQLAMVVAEMVFNKEKINEMSRCQVKLGEPKAASKIVAVCNKLMGGN